VSKSLEKAGLQTGKVVLSITAYIQLILNKLDNLKTFFWVITRGLAQISLYKGVERRFQ